MRGMYLAYVDESGEGGRGGRCAVAVVLVPHAQWRSTLEELVGFREWVRQFFGIRVREELKARYLLHNSGASFRQFTNSISEEARFAIYRQHMRVQPKLGLATFAVVIRQPEMSRLHPGRDARDLAWQLLLAELGRFTPQKRTETALMHGGGSSVPVGGVARRAYRALTTSDALARPADLLLDAVSAPGWMNSLFFQLADLNAHAAFRAVYPPPPPIRNRRRVVVPQTWGELGTARWTARKTVPGPVTGITVSP